MSNTMMKTGSPVHYSYGRQASNRAFSIASGHMSMALLLA